LTVSESIRVWNVESLLETMHIERRGRGTLTNKQATPTEKKIKEERKRTKRINEHIENAETKKSFYGVFEATVC